MTLSILSKNGSPTPLGTPEIIVSSTPPMLSPQSAASSIFLIMDDSFSESMMGKSFVLRRAISSFSIGLSEIPPR